MSFARTNGVLCIASRFLTDIQDTNVTQVTDSAHEAVTGHGTSEEHPTKRERLDSVDMLRGIAIVLMSLDHVREFLSASQINPTDIAQTTLPLFLTRWVTHFCAPIFVFLAGTGAFLYRQRGHTSTAVAGFLLTRGLWLVFLELTAVRLAWFFNLDYSSHSVAQVIWVIGWSMVVMSALVFIPIQGLAIFGMLLIVLHNCLDPVTADSFGSWAWLWRFLHDRGPLTPLPGMPVYVAYPLIPWVGVMASGYAFGKVLQLPRVQRRKLMLSMGVLMTLAFIGLRALNVYGDPAVWSRQPEFSRTFMSFLNLEKYPPSLLFLLMTLGPALVGLSAADRPAGAVGRFLIVFGRVPLFYYVLHLYLIHALTLCLVYLQTGDTPAWLFSFPPGHAGEGCGFSLPVVYLIWLGVVFSLYPLCRWFAGVKRRRSDAWLTYL